MPEPSSKRTLLKFIEVCVATITLLLIAALLIPKLWDGYISQPFDVALRQRRLNHGNHDRHSLRQRMAKDLINSNRLLGLNRSQIEQLLGQPNEYPYSTSESIGYALGYYKDSVDEEWLVITFSSDGGASGVTRRH